MEDFDKNVHSLLEYAKWEVSANVWRNSCPWKEGSVWKGLYLESAGGDIQHKLSVELLQKLGT